MDYIAIAQALITKHEGMILHIYPDTCNDGSHCIGVGHNVEHNGESLYEYSGGITKERAEEILADDIKHCVGALATYGFWPTLDDARKAVLIDMVFEIGAHGFSAFRGVIHALFQKDYVGAANNILNSKLGQQVRKREQENAAIMRSGVYSA